MSDADLVFKDERDNLVVIMGHVLTRLLSYRQLHHLTPESAGVLIGERRGLHLVICDISEPGPGDIRQRNRVDRRGIHHQLLVNEAFESSGGIHQYLGEWHTHPEDKPCPSHVDRDSWNRGMITKVPMLVLIVGREGYWLGKKEKETIETLELI
ncbi:Mov34/MPN/PAD-1 family protein [Vibrio tubiashii]|uniref:CBASS system CD-NTase/cGAS isopeptidase Cap3 n=1 Tax=Vibrio tubiashii TaxID=29498 RepID=UPI001EFD031A|nr:Mov34/MPN/PAD-1 family protein [Vibrio tubiashii]MCG9575176.1 Mov34/MPN/PAD-1 family protein [Vibrio tubiashii]